MTIKAKGAEIGGGIKLGGELGECEDGVKFSIQNFARDTKSIIATLQLVPMQICWHQ